MFNRLEKVIGKEMVSSLFQKKVLVIGCGGVGGYVIEGLARSGIGSFTIVDYDTVEESNKNRQIIALDSTIGRKKVEVMKERILDINPNCKVMSIDSFIDQNNIEDIFQVPYDFVVDACDTLLTKKELIKECLKRNIPFVSSMGTGNKLDPSQLEIIDIRKTKSDPLARILRKFVKEEKIKGKIMVLSSKEVPVKTHERTPGSTAFVPSSAGLLIASYIVRYFMENNSNINNL